MTTTTTTPTIDRARDARALAAPRAEDATHAGARRTPMPDGLRLLLALNAFFLVLIAICFVMAKQIDY